MTEVLVYDNETLEMALKRFKKLMQRNGILSDIKRHEYYEKPSEKRKRKFMAARKRELKRMRRQREGGE